MKTGSTRTALLIDMLIVVIKEKGQTLSIMGPYATEMVDARVKDRNPRQLFKLLSLVRSFSAGQSLIRSPQSLGTFHWTRSSNQQ